MSSSPFVLKMIPYNSTMVLSSQAKSGMAPIWLWIYCLQTSSLIDSLLWHNIGNNATSPSLEKSEPVCICPMSLCALPGRELFMFCVLQHCLLITLFLVFGSSLALSYNLKILLLQKEIFFYYLPYFQKLLNPFMPIW